MLSNEGLDLFDAKGFVLRNGKMLDVICLDHLLGARDEILKKISKEDLEH